MGNEETDAEKYLIHECFSKCARQFSNEIAVISENDVLTYQELHHRSNQLAHYLRHMGIVKSQGPVGIGMGRTPDLIVAILGVLKSGGAYLPLDATYPAERIAYLAEDSKMPLVLSHSDFSDNFKELKTECLFLDTRVAEIGQEPTSMPHISVASDEPAYVIYTSGSTGQPKGVCCHHKGVMNLLMDFQDRKPIGEGDLGSWWTSLNFDVSVYEIFSTLTAGAALVMTPEPVRTDAPALMEWLYGLRVTSAYLPPMMLTDLDVWIKKNPDKCTLRRLLVGVEPIQEILLDSISENVRDLQIINGYGPTETTVCATLYGVGPENEPHENVPIGKPVRHMWVYLVDSNGQPVSEGDPGEIWIGGTGVALGYLNRPQLTAERFRPDPFSKDSGARVYKTGDMARLLPDGNLMFMGRRDFQVKFHGYRIELGEIETLLRSHPAVREATVLLREDDPGFKRLVAYVVFMENNIASFGELRDFSKKFLPEYMAPSVFVRLDQMPTTPNGKTDRDILPAPDPNDLMTLNHTPYVPPKSQIEKALAEIFQQVLGIHRVGINDNFFDLGGHSLLATRVCSTISKNMNVEISLKTFFDGPTVAELAESLMAGHRATDSGFGDPISHFQGSRRKFPVSYAQKGIWLLHQMDEQGILFNIPLNIHMKGPLNPSKLHDAFHFMIKKHEILRTSFSMTDTQLLQNVHGNSSFRIPLVDGSAMSISQREKKLAGILREVGAYPFDLSKPPLMKAVLVCINPFDHQLVFTIHHILIDGWGASLFFSELYDAYHALVRGGVLSESTPPIQYGDVVLWQRKQLERPEIRNQTAYWKNKLKGPRAELNLPMAHSRSRFQTFAGARHHLDFSEKTTAALKALARNENATLFMVMLSAFKALLFTYTRETDVIVGSTIANRNHPQLEKIIGVFINSLVMRTDLSGDPGFKTLLKRVRQTAIEAYDHQNMSFEKLLEALALERDTSRNPIFQILFILQNTPPAAITSSNTTWTYEEVGNGTAKVDILLNLEERGNRLEGWFEYNRDLFDANVIKGMAEDLKWVTAGILENPNLPLSHIRTRFFNKTDGVKPRIPHEGFSCFIIGEGSLPLQCGEILLKKGCTICGMISPDEENHQWAFKRDIPVFKPDKNMAVHMEGCSFDYLFSIVNSHVLAPSVLNLPRRYAVNYHDSPLPRYAGIHATAWAIMNGEKNHGITWHVAAEGVDTGDILQQEMFQIDSNETSLTLNAKCYEAAVRCFDVLVENFLENKTAFYPQDLARRTYYALYQRPPAGGVISWRGNASDIDALVRALDFGNYDNPLGYAKIALNHDFVIVSKTALLDDNSGKEAGTIVAANERSLVLATGLGDLAVQSLKTIDGAPLTLSQWIADSGLSVGKRLPNLDPAIAVSLSTLNAEISPYEAYWVGKMTDLRPLQLGCQCRGEPVCSSFTGQTHRSAPASNIDVGRNDDQDPKFTTITARIVDPAPEKDIGRAPLLVIAAFSAFLARFCQISTFDLGFRYHGLSQNMSGLEGFFAPYVPLRVQVGGDASFKDFRETLQYEIDQTIRRKTFARDLTARYPALDWKTPRRENHPFAAAVEWVENLSGYEPVPGPGLVLVIPKDGKTCCMAYDPRVFNRSHVQGLMDRFVNFLKRLMAPKSQAIKNISLLTDAEYHRQIVAWNDTDRGFPEHLCVHHLFEAKADRTPDAIAVMHGEKAFSYRELNLRANRLAWKLQKMGVGPEMLVGICMERSVDMITGILGILKAGGAYVPLDPTYPLERIASMLKDSNVPIVLTQAHLKETLCEFNGQIIFLNDERETADDESLENPAHRTTGRNTAYVIYTSGSTGTPKGVMVLHQGVVNHALAVAERFNMASCDRVAQFFSISFDGAVEEIFMTLTQGAALVLLPFDPLPSMNVFMEWLEKDRVTVLDLPSAFWHEWMHWLTDSQKPLPMTLRAVIVGGEKASESAFNTWMKHTGGRIRWFNTYGPTETTVVSTIFEPDLQNTEKPPAVISIGRPIANTRIYVVDQNLQPVPVGMSGEMLIGGLGVARGYLNRGNLTAKKFIRDPFREDGRVYRTGDRVRYLPDGQIDFIGRFDSQVKIRGFRVEPGEVEAALHLCPAVGQAAVAVRADRRGEKCLAAYVVPKKGAASDPSFFKQFLKQKLPSYLVPSDVVLLGSFPRLPNGKVDRRSLPDPHMAPTTMDSAFVAPTTPLQKQLAEIWKSVLGISKVGIQDHFFELGGHSLLAVRLCSEIENQIGKRIPLQTLFQAPTIEKLSQEIESGKTPEDFQSLIEIQAGGEKPPLFFIHVLGAGLHFCRPLIKYLGENQPVYGLSVHLLGGRLPTPNRVEDLAAHYVKEMRLIQPEGPYLLAGISFGGMVAYEMARQLLESGEKTAFLTLLDTVGPGAVKSASAGSRASAHWESLMDEGPAYILNKLKWRMKRLQRSFQLVGFRIRRVYLDLYEKTERPLNAGLRDFRARSYNKDAMERYVPRPYDGSVVLFRSHERILGVGVEVDPELGWGKLAKAGIEVFEAPSGHLGMLREPHVRFVGETIRTCIDQALLK